MFWIRTNELVSINAPTPTHKTHTDNVRWSLSRKHSGFPRSRGSLPKPAENNERDRREELDPGLTTLWPIRMEYLR